MARAEMSSSGTKYSPASNRRPTSAMAGIMASSSTAAALRPLASAALVASSTVSRMPSKMP